MNKENKRSLCIVGSWVMFVVIVTAARYTSPLVSESERNLQLILKTAALAAGCIPLIYLAIYGLLIFGGVLADPKVKSRREAINVCLKYLNHDFPTKTW
jgi:hypothetical protein